MILKPYRRNNMRTLTRKEASYPSGGTCENYYSGPYKIQKKKTACFNYLNSYPKDTVGVVSKYGTVTIDCGATPSGMAHPGDMIKCNSGQYEITVECIAPDTDGFCEGKLFPVSG